MKRMAITIDVESDSAAFANRIAGVQGVRAGLPIYLDFMRERDYPITVFISGDILQYLDVDSIDIKNPRIEIASHGYEHTYPPNYMTALSSEAMEEQISKSKSTLEILFKVRALGFRAHGLVVTTELMEKIAKHYVYDSSIILHRKYEGKVLRSSLPYHPSRRCVVEEGEMPITELPVFSKKVFSFKLPFIGSYIRLLPKQLFYGVDQSLIILDLHCQDVVKFKNWKYLFVERYLTKLEKVLSYYENRGYKFSLMKELVNLPELKMNAM